MRGFTIIEFLIVLGVLAMILTLSYASFSFLTKKGDLNSSTNNVFSALTLVKNKTIASEGAKQYGIYFDTNLSPNKFIIFQGSNYASREISFDEIHFLPKGIEFSSISFSGIGNEVVFNRLEGNTNNSGSIVLHSLKTDNIETIYVYPSGEPSFRVETISGVGRVFDSRHVHFDLGWDISGSTILKFDFSNAGQIRQVDITNYFSIDDLDWEGEFIINNIVQKFRVHTHQLTPTTQLCVHRDRDENKNNEEVYIYIIQSGIEKQIAHFDHDLSATVYKGNYVWNQMQIQ
jgi:prepilin-type N-terminal cleavage/methylation domain-containing protein